MSFNLRCKAGRPLLKTSAYFLLGVIGMCTASGCSFNVKYDTYVSKDPGLGVVVEYVSGWKASEQHGSRGSFVQAIFVEPKGKDKTIKSASMVITVQPGDKVILPSSTLEAFTEDLISRRMQFTDAKVLSRSAAKVCGLAAVDILLTYKSLDKLYAADSRFVLYKERAILFTKDGRFYTLRYENGSKAFPKFEKAFSHIVRTLKVK